MALGVYMDVKIQYLFLTLLFAACAQNKTADSVFKQGKLEEGKCPTSSVLPNQFIVRYEDGRVEIVQSENLESFKKNYVQPRLAQIKSAEFDTKVYLNGPDPVSTEMADSGTSLQASGLSSNDYGQILVRATDVWSQGVTGSGVIVAVLDEAVDISHPYLKNQFAINSLEVTGSTGVDEDKNGYADDYIGWNFITNKTSGVVEDGSLEHGTHVAGIIAGDGSVGNFSGVAPGAKLLPVSFLDQSHGSIGTAILAMRYAAQRGAKIINASWGGPDCSDILSEEITNLEKNNILFIAAAGNSSTDYDRGGTYEYPAVFNLPNMITVAASNAQDFLTNFSNRSFSLVHIAAPGMQIRSTVPTAKDASGFYSLSGTSMATPFVSGAAALLWSAKPNASASQIRQAILSSADSRQLKVSTQGRLNILRALDEIRRIAP